MQQQQVDHIGRFLKRYNNEKDFKNAFELIIDTYNNGENSIQFIIQCDLDTLLNFIKTIECIGIKGTYSVFDSWKRKFYPLKDILQKDISSQIEEICFADLRSAKLPSEDICLLENEHDYSLLIGIAKYNKTSIMLTFDN